MKKFEFENSFSFEKVCIPNLLRDPGFLVYEHSGVFVDIGIPEDFNSAEEIINGRNL